jgi:hypothetical protein
MFMPIAPDPLFQEEQVAAADLNCAAFAGERKPSSRGTPWAGKTLALRWLFEDDLETR